MSPEEMYAALKPGQEKKGYYFNPDHDWVLDVLGGVQTNKARYGYGSCPCRLATGQKEKDRDIICPCLFREEDVAKYEQCYCRLYVSREVAEGRRQASMAVPERWIRK